MKHFAIAIATFFLAGCFEYGAIMLDSQQLLIFAIITFCFATLYTWRMYASLVKSYNYIAMLKVAPFKIIPHAQESGEAVPGKYINPINVTFFFGQRWRCIIINEPVFFATSTMWNPSVTTEPKHLLIFFSARLQEGEQAPGEYSDPLKEFLITRNPQIQEADIRPNEIHYIFLAHYLADNQNQPELLFNGLQKALLDMWVDKIVVDDFVATIQSAAYLRRYFNAHTAPFIAPMDDFLQSL